MENFRTTNKKQLAARVLCTLLLGTYLVGGYGEPVAWGASATNASVNVSEDTSSNASSAWGENTTASSKRATAWGYYTEAKGGTGSTAWGSYTVASGIDATAFGSHTEASNSEATAFGYYTKAKGLFATAFGWHTETASSYAPTAWGIGTKETPVIATGNASTAFGVQTSAKGHGSTAWGGYYDGTNYYKGGTASGDASTAFGIQTKASGQGATAWGYKSIAEGKYATAFGDSSQALAENSLAALGGIVEKDATNSIAIGKGSSVSSADSIAIGTGLKVSGKNSGAFGDPGEVSGSNSYAFGNNNTVSGDNTFVLGNNISTGAKNAVVLGNGSEGVDNAVSVGAKGKERQIKNVAPGTDDSDATTVKQVKEMIEAGGGAADLAPINRRIDNVDSKINKVGAGAAALAALHPMDTDGKFSMAAGFGNYRDANAMALGVFYRPNDQVMFSMGGSLGNGENLLNVGVSFALDKGVSTSKAAMAKKIASLTEENAQQAAKIETLEARLAALEAKLGK